MIPLYNLNNIEMKNISPITPIESETNNFIFSTLIVITLVGLGLYVIKIKYIN
jgi:hypothetical protein